MLQKQKRNYKFNFNKTTKGNKKKLIKEVIKKKQKDKGKINNINKDKQKKNGKDKNIHIDRDKQKMKK